MSTHNAAEQAKSQQRGNLQSATAHYLIQLSFFTARPLLRDCSEAGYGSTRPDMHSAALCPSDPLAACRCQATVKGET
jgi:hypothetical protein